MCVSLSNPLHYLDSCPILSLSSHSIIVRLFPVSSHSDLFILASSWGPMSPLLLLLLLILLPNDTSSAGLCSRNICINGGTCIVREDESFGCRCPNGKGGLICEVDCGCIHGDCDGETKNCKCHKGWIGEKCDIEGPQPTLSCKGDLDCPSDQRCLEKDSSRMCMVDPCHNTPCRHGGQCTIRNGVQHCECVLGFKGVLCDEDENECERDPCRNGGTCVNMLGNFSCLCVPPYSGDVCEQEGCVDYCGGVCIASSPATFSCLCANGTLSSHSCTPKSSSPCGDCLNGGKCAPVTAGKHECICNPDYTGIACEQKLECTVNGQSCMNGGRCIHGVGSAYCQCTQEYNGENCERQKEEITTTTPPHPCTHVRCANGGHCTVSNGIASCQCPNRFKGTWCEVMIDACENVHCANGGRCRNLGDDEASFECICPRGFGGIMCDEVVDTFGKGTTIGGIVNETHPLTQTTESDITSEPIAPITTVTTETVAELTCDQCVHSTRCIETFEGALCVCEDGMKGSKCDEPSSSCSTHSCPIGQSCTRRLSLSSLSFGCGCPIGRRGDSCSIVTSISFTRQSMFVHQSPHVMIGSSSGPLSYAVSFSFRTTVPQLHLITGEDLFGSRLYSLYIQEGRLTINVSSTSFILMPHPVTDGDWYTVQLNKTEKDLIVSLIEENGRHLFTRSLPRSSSFDVFSTKLGKISDKENFVGCIADFFIDGELRDIVDLPRAVALTRGCDRKHPCEPFACGTGMCMDEWDSYYCICPPPLLPPHCQHSLPPSTLGHHNLSSYAHLSIPPQVADELKYHCSISLVLRTMKKDSVILVVGERVEHSDSSDLATFLALQIVNGMIHGRARVGRKVIVDVDSDTRVDDNEEHVVMLNWEKNRLTISVDGIERGEAKLENRFDYPLFADSILIGTSNGSAHGAFTTQEYFKGSLQDIRVNDLSAVLHQTQLEVKPVGSLLHSHNILEGMISDDICSSSPCSHGTCTNIFNSFHCSCHNGWVGDRCDRQDFCLINSCPPSTKCYNDQDGFTCSAPAHLVEASFAEFQRSSPIPVEKIRFSIRTHSDRAHILSLDGSYQVALSDGRLVVGPSSSPFTIRLPINTGTWQNITLNKNVLRIGNDTFGIPKTSALSLPSLSSIRVGSTPLLSSFWGCIDGIEIESSTPLSFLPPNGNISVGWEAVKRHRIHGRGCLSTPQCGIADSCMNGATCEDNWNSRTCHCLPGWTGEQCEREVNECARTHCVHGNCIDRLGEAECVCHSGYSGSSCETPVDPCQGGHGKCLNDGVCRRSSDSSWNCLCLPGFHGATCSLQGNATCDVKSCGNGGVCHNDNGGFSCQCTGGHLGEHCEVPPSLCEVKRDGEGPCGNHGLCTVVGESVQCKCLPGYTGVHCDSLVDLCTPSSCNTHGTCTSALNETLCQCNAPWNGRYCSHRLGGCTLIPCANDGECEENAVGETICKCREYYLGSRCELPGSCLSSPCLNGLCVQKTPTEHICKCDEGLKGDKCEIEINMCESSPCANGARCESSRGKFICHCAPGFDGPRCDLDIDECASAPCQNGGKCIDRVADYECQCGEAFTGRHCETDVDECAVEGVCVHGECSNTHGSFMCQCSMGYLGARCSLRNPCVPDTNNRTIHMCVHGLCSNAVTRSEGKREWAEHECTCHSGYIGPTCATKREESRISIGYVLGPLVVILVVLALLGCALLIFVLKGKSALHGHYSPSQQEDAGRYPMGTMLKLPPEERLI